MRVEGAQEGAGERSHGRSIEAALGRSLRTLYTAVVPLDPRLLEMLRCPACRGVVRPLPSDAGLACEGCRRVYPIVDGIPVMMVEEARVPDA